MDERELLAQRFEAHRSHLHTVAYRMLGSIAEANDAVQEAWLRVSRAGDDDIDNVGGWLTTIVGRVCLDMLRTRNARHEEALDAHEPAERVAFVLHDMFDLPFDEIAPIVGRTPVATRQLASRARRRVRGASTSNADRARHREIVEAFLAASKAGDFDALVAILDPDVVFRTDAQGVRMGAPAALRGAASVAGMFNGRAQAAVPGLIDGEVGVLVPIKGRMLLVFELRFRDGKIAAMDAVAEREALGALEVTSIAGGDPLVASATTNS